jgi:linoleoyl-CoA desaturase
LIAKLKQHDIGTDPEGQMPSRTTVAPLKFGESDGYQLEMRRRIDAYFETTGKSPRDCPQMYLKTAVIMTWFVGSYVALVFFANTWWQAVPLAISLGLAMAGIGFSIQHDGGHQAYSNHRWVNKLMALTLDLLGGSSYVWAKKHNQIHHSYSNITGHDDDIDIGVLGRLSPHQPWLKVHRFQHLYLWFLYGMLPIKWQIFDDFRDILKGRIAAYPIPMTKGWEAVLLLGGKITFFSLALVLPMCLHPVWSVLLLYVLASFVQGVTLSVVFQLAHCVEEANFPMPESGRMETAWAVHQVETTVDFGRHNRLLTWYVGGLNYQIEHHLFPRICHIHYPAISGIVEETSREFGVRYIAHETLRQGIASHFRWLRRMGANRAP